MVIRKSTPVPSATFDDDLVERLVEQYRTPLYAYDAASIRHRMATILDAIDYRPADVYYSCKANAAVGVVRFLRSLGARLDACSPGDLAIGRAAGFSDEEISYVGHSLTDAEVDLVAASDVFFTADSLSQLERIAHRSPGRRIGLRINPSVVAGFHPHVQAGARDSKFGIQPEQLEECLSAAARLGLYVVGIHAHLGSDVLDVGPHVEVLEKLLLIGSALPELQFVNVGGGWGTPFDDVDPEYDMEAFGRRASALMRTESARRGRDITLRLEPGAYLLMDAGVLITRVNEIKPGPPGDPSVTRFVCTDTSYNHVVSAVLYQTKRAVRVAGRGSQPLGGTCTITGNLMQAGDVLAREVRLPQAEPGDVLVIPSCGAYASSRAPTFNERPRPAEVLVDGGAVIPLRRAETVDDLLCREIAPARTRGRGGDSSHNRAP